MQEFQQSLRAVAFLTLLVTASGCVDGYVHERARQSAKSGMARGGPPNTGDSGSNFPEEIQTRVENYRDGGFEKLTRSPFASSAASGKQISIYVNEQNVSDYLAATSTEEASSSDTELAEGTTIVREIRNRDGKVEKLTLAVQRGDSYHQSVDGLWFGVMKPDNTYVRESGERKVGALNSCAGCHANRAQTDYLYGVPEEHLSVRTPGDSDDSSQSDDSGKPSMGNDGGDGTDSSSNDTSENTRTLQIRDYRLVNRERDLQRTQSAKISRDVELEPGDVVLLARKASRTEFEQYWNVTLGPDTEFVNMNNTSSLGAPIVNGEEIWELQDRSKSTVDGPTPEGRKDSTYERLDFTGDMHVDWGRANQQHATPGTSRVDRSDGDRPGLIVSEWADADEYRMEFVELKWIPKRATPATSN